MHFGSTKSFKHYLFAHSHPVLAQENLQKLGISLHLSPNIWGVFHFLGVAGRAARAAQRGSAAAAAAADARWVGAAGGAGGTRQGAGAGHGKHRGMAALGCGKLRWSIYPYIYIYTYIYITIYILYVPWIWMEGLTWPMSGDLGVSFDIFCSVSHGFKWHK